MVYIFVIICTEHMQFSNDTTLRHLNEEEFTLFQPVCMNLSLPVQSPVHVGCTKKFIFLDGPTGRSIEYKSSEEITETMTKADYPSVIAVDPDLNQFGYISSLFQYRGINFAVISKFESVVQITDGLVLIANCRISTKVILLLTEISRPLLIANANFPELWIINV